MYGGSPLRSIVVYSHSWIVQIVYHRPVLRANLIKPKHVRVSRSKLVHERVSTISRLLHYAVSAFLKAACAFNHKPLSRIKSVGRPSLCRCWWFRVTVAKRSTRRAFAQCAARESEVHVTGTIRRPHHRLGIGIVIPIITAFMLSALARQ